MGAGVSGALALLQHELTELGRSVAFGGTTLEQFTKLGATTHALSPDVAPIGGPMARSPPYAEEVGQQALDVLPQIEPVSTRDARVARIASSPVGRESGEQSRSPGAPRSDIADSIARPEFADGTATVPIVSIQRMASAPRDVSKADVPISASVPPLPQRAPLAARYFVTLAPPDLAVPPFPGSPSTSSAESGETIPNSAETISPVTVSPVTMPPATMPPVTVAPVTMSPVTNWPRPGYGHCVRSNVHWLFRATSKNHSFDITRRRSNIGAFHCADECCDVRWCLTRVFGCQSRCSEGRTACCTGTSESPGVDV